jgi:hypothetical protein
MKRPQRTKSISSVRVLERGLYERAQAFGIVFNYWVAYLRVADNVSGPLPSRLRGVNQPVIRSDGWRRVYTRHNEVVE